MAKSGPSKKSPHAAADRFYQYLIDRREEVLRYILAALATGIVQYLLQLFLPDIGYWVLLPYAVRFFALFYLLKYWAYGEGGSGAFYTGRQLMIAIMGVLIVTWLLQNLTLFFAALLGNARLVQYVGSLFMELAYFFFFQLIVFKEPE